MIFAVVKEDEVMTNKYIIEVEETYVSADSYEETSKVRPEKLYRIKGFNSLVFDESGWNKLTEYHEDEPVEDNYPKSVRWKPGFHNKYYYIDSAGVVCTTYWENYESDKTRYALGNMFKTEEEAKFAIEQFKVLAELKEYADDDKEWDRGNIHWCIEYDAHDRRMYVNVYNFIIKAPFKFYFSSDAQAKKAIDAIGEERLKKYYFCVEE